MQQHSQIVVRLPKLRVQCNRLAVSGRGRIQIALVAERDAQVVVHVGIVGLQCEGFVKRVDGRWILGIGVQAKSEKAIRLGIPGIDAERGAGLGYGAVGIVGAIEHIGQTAVNIGKAGHEPL